MVKQHLNFYETIEEARMRIDQTVVLYDGEPYLVLCVATGKPDGIFRVYLDPFTPDGKLYSRINSVPYEWHDELGMTKMQKMDLFLEQGGDSCPIIRKMMNSPLFNKFRPFSLGMANEEGYAVYVERSPVRHTQQGLTGPMLSCKGFDLVSNGRRGLSPGGKVSLFSRSVYSAITAKHPDIDTVLTNLTDKDNLNTSAAFHREFAVVRGPCNLLFFAYRGEIVGFLPENNTSRVKISKEHEYLKEVVDELSVFNSIL